MEWIMNKISVSLPLSLLILFIFFLSAISLFYPSKAHAEENAPSLNGTKLAYFIGYHTYSRSSILVNPRPVYRASGAYWTGWRASGFKCQQRCLIDKWTGLVIQCKRRC